MSCNAKKDPNGTWRIQYRWTDWTGTKRKSQKRGFKTKKEAEEWYAHFMLQQSSDPTMTLADFWEIYKADMEKRLRKTTMKQKEYMMNDKVLRMFFGGVIWLIVDSMPIFLVMTGIVNDIYEIWYIVLGINVCFAIGVW